jgi:hypothetical protein
MGWVAAVLDRMAGPPAATVESETPRAVGLGVALGAGVGVGAAVHRTFIALDPNGGGFVAVGGGLGLLACLCTGVGAWAAMRQPTLGRALLWTFLANVGPPTLVCAPTVIGLFFSIPAGVLAFAAVVPLVVAARRWAHPATPGWSERELLAGAGFAVLSALGMNAYQLVATSSSTGPYDFIPVFFASLAAATMCIAAGAPDARRAIVLSVGAAGRLPGYRIAPHGPSGSDLVRHATAGAGPHRAASTHEVVGVIPHPWRRLALAAALFVASACAPLAFAAIVLAS